MTRHGDIGNSSTPEPDDRPEPSTEPPPRSWRYVISRSVQKFSADTCTDLAAALTYYAVLSLFPAMVALVSLPAVFGQGQETTDELLSILDDVAPASVVDNVRGPLEDLSTVGTAGLALVIGLVAALWSASGYVGAFGRAMNRIYGFEEGRPFWRLRPIMLLVTTVTVLLVLITAVLLVVTGPLASAVGDSIGVGDTAVTVWDIAKWPVILAIVVLIVAILYYATPNVRQPRFRWLSVGSVVAILTWAVASAGFGFYVANFSSYDRTYGSLAGVIVFLLWLWLTNLALLFGAELDAESERLRELRAGIAAEEAIQLPPRDTRQIDKAAAKNAEVVRDGRRLRMRRHAKV